MTLWQNYLKILVLSAALNPLYLPLAQAQESNGYSNGQVSEYCREARRGRTNFDINRCLMASSCGEGENKLSCQKAYMESAGQTADANSSSAKEPITQAGNQNLCEEQTKLATNYCTDPISYSSDGDIEGSPEAAGVAGNLLTMTSMYNAATGGSNRTICNIMSTGGAAALGLNGTFAARCGSFISDCEKSCKDANDNTTLRKCSANRRRQAEMTAASAQSFTASLMGKACKQAATVNSLAGTIAPPEMPAVGADCVSDPNNPLCRNTGTGGPGDSSSSYSNTGSGAMDGKGSDDFNVAAGKDGDPSQGGNTGGAALDPAKNGGVANGGGSMLGGGNSGAAGGGDERGGRGAGGGYKTDVLQGERAGGGYNVAQGSVSSGGGWSGYGGGTEERRGNGLDLRKFLPGQDKAPMRGPAGLNRANAEVAPMHEDIFKKISDRVMVVCKTNRLRDCR